MARSRDYKSIRYDSAIDGHCAACSSANLRQASSNRRSMSRGWLAERTGTTRPRRRRRAVRHMPYLPHRTHQLVLRARRGSQQERHRLSAGPQRKPSSSFFSRDARQCGFLPSYRLLYIYIYGNSLLMILESIHESMIKHRAEPPVSGQWTCSVQTAIGNLNYVTTVNHHPCQQQTVLELQRIMYSFVCLCV